MANPHRKRGTGKGTPSAWRSVGLEGAPVLPDPIQKKDKAESKVFEFRQKKPIKAENIHVGTVAGKTESKSGVYRTGPTIETANRKPLRIESEEEKIERLVSEFGDLEQRFVRAMIDDYPYEFWDEKQRREDRGAKTTDRWVSAYRTSYIIKKLTWGKKRQLAPEKAAIFEKYLDLYLPKGIPEEKYRDVNQKAEEMHLDERDAFEKTEKEVARKKLTLS